MLYDCRRDLHDIEFDCIPVMNLRDSPYGTVIDPDTFIVYLLFHSIERIVLMKVSYS